MINCKVGAVILAAGMSQRMGKTKQLIKFNNKYLLEIVIQRVLSVNFSSIIAVIGHEAEIVKSFINVNDLRFRWVINENYKNGLGTSLKIGMKESLKENKSMMIFLGDTPFIKQKTMESILKVGKEIESKYEEPIFLQPTYKNVPGHPVFLGNVHLHHVTEMHGDSGAKALLNKFTWRKRSLGVNDFGVVQDIDTREAYIEAKKWMALYENDRMF